MYSTDRNHVMKINEDNGQEWLVKKYDITRPRIRDIKLIFDMKL